MHSVKASDECFFVKNAPYVLIAFVLVFQNVCDNPCQKASRADCNLSGCVNSTDSQPQYSLRFIYPFHGSPSQDIMICQKL